MRTKTLLLTAACAVIGTVAASAQSVYSVNAVGYVNVNIPTGLSIIANPLNTTNNAISNILASVPDNTTVYTWNGTKLNPNNYFAGDGWDYPATQLAPGTGAWIRNRSGAASTVTFVGEVLTGSLTNAIPVGLSLKASIVPQSAALDTVLGYTPNDNDKVYLYRNGNWKIYTYFVGDGWDQGSSPVPAVGEGFWIKTSTTAQNWVRTFTIN
jgi:hypothetical protein